MKATATANASVALTKYWGKRNKELILPFNSNLAMTCSDMTTKTTVEFSEEYNDFEDHLVIINDEEFKRDEKDVQGHLDRIAKIAGVTMKAKVVSESNFPVAAGLASSTSGFAALTMAACEALGLKYSPQELSMLVRRGSGSATRSIMGGFVKWNRGNNEDGSDSYAEEVFDKDFWPEFRMIATIVQVKKKDVSSRGGMAQTVDTCPYYEKWVETAEVDTENIIEAIGKKDFQLVGEIAEFNALKMHATMITTKPSIIYWIPATMEIIHEVRQLREEGIQAFFTIDAGPNVKVVCLEKDEKHIIERLKLLTGVIDTISCGPGEGAKIVDSHLF